MNTSLLPTLLLAAAAAAPAFGVDFLYLGQPAEVFLYNGNYYAAPLGQVGGHVHMVSPSQITIVVTPSGPAALPAPVAAVPTASPAVTGAGAVAGWALVGVLGGVAIYKSGQYFYYANQLVDDVGSEPAHNLTSYEDPGNYWQQFWWYYWGTSNG